MYNYNAKLLRVVDGDTIDFMTDLGFGVFKKIRVRLHDIDTWEMRGENKEKGKAAKVFVEQFLSNQKNITIKTFKDKTGKYGRYLAKVFINDGSVNLGEELAKNGHRKIK